MCALDEKPKYENIIKLPRVKKNIVETSFRKCMCDAKLKIILIASSVTRLKSDEGLGVDSMYPSYARLSRF